MSDILYNPAYIQKCQWHMEELCSRYKRIAAELEENIDEIEKNCAESSKIQLLVSEIKEKNDAVQAKLKKLTEALEYINSLYIATDENVDDITEKMQKSVIPQSWKNIPLSQKEVEVYMENDLDFNRETATELFNSQLQPPQWLIGKIIADKINEN